MLVYSIVACHFSSVRWPSGLVFILYQYVKGMCMCGERAKATDCIFLFISDHVQIVNQTCIPQNCLSHPASERQHQVSWSETMSLKCELSDQRSCNFCSDCCLCCLLSSWIWNKKRGIRSIVTIEIWVMVQKMLKVIRAGSTEGIMGDVKDQQAEELKCCWEWAESIIKEKMAHGGMGIMRLQRTLGILEWGRRNYSMDVDKWKPVLCKISLESCSVKVFLSNYMCHLAMQTRKAQ